VSRLFFALWPEDTQREMLAHAVHEVVRASGGRPVPTHNLHITLAFLGSVPDGRIPELSSMARAVAAGFPRGVLPIAVRFDAVEHWRKAQIVCAIGRRPMAGEADETAAAATQGNASVPPGSAMDEGTAAGAAWLAKALQDGAARAGFTPDLKLFRPHVTVARKVVRPTRLLDIDSVRWEFVRFALLESRTQASGPIYSVVEPYVLSGDGGHMHENT
jgi:2'-5' RNA ligase